MLASAMLASGGHGRIGGPSDRQGGELGLDRNITLGGAGRERDHALRADPAGLAAAFAEGAILVLWRGRPLVIRAPDGAATAPDSGLAWLPSGHPMLAGAGPAVFLGRRDDGRPAFAVDLPHWQPEEAPLPAGPFDPGLAAHPLAPPGAAFADLRFVMADLAPAEAEAAATARALLEWHRGHGYCAACGAPSLAERGGWQRRCPACGAVHFPRTDPVVIMLVTRGNRALLGRSPGWPEGMYSCLAGFMEPGETVEAAVRREVAEETGVRVGPVRYLASQPWPFPASLMLGCHALARTTAVTLDPEELEDALWIGREELVEVMSGTHPRLRAPRKGAIAAHLVAMWLEDRAD
jgi:NAD+ diphosphatase